jgi:membrane fusion protein (multidrug efflux system)
MRIEEEIETIQDGVHVIGEDVRGLETELNNLEQPPAKKKGPNPVVLGVVALFALAAVFKGYGAYNFGLTHVETDDAYITGDLVGISPSVGGNLVELKVQDGDFVKKGQLIAMIDTSGPEAELSQAKANLQAARTQIPQAQAELSFAKLSTDASIKKSMAALSAQSARIDGSRLQVNLSRDTVKNQIRQADSQLSAVKAQESQAQAYVEAAKASVNSARQAVFTADRNTEASKSAVAAAKADSDRAAKDLERYRQLVESDAISRQQFDSASATASAAAANYESAVQRAEAAASEAAQARVGVQQAIAQLRVAEKQADASSKQVQVSQASLALAHAGSTNVGIQDTNVRSTEGQEGQAVADLANSQAGLEQVNLRQTQIGTAQAQVLQAQAAVERAEIHLRDCRLIAPCDGYVVKHTVNVGTALNAGQTIVTMTRGSDVWVMGNFKETQLKDVGRGQQVAINVDAFPGREFKGRVITILRATGSATTLLPPDNSTGNFTKIVQRVPVKIAIETDNKSDADLLRQGMSVSATIDTASKGSE